MERRNGVVATADLINEMVRLPTAAFFYGMEWMYRALRGLQPMDPAGGTVAAAGSSTSISRQEKGTTMDDQHLGGDDLKYVSYSILFTKRDLEAPLEEKQNDLVNYPTDGGSYGGLKIAKFLVDLAGDAQDRRPEVWKESDYPPKDKEGRRRLPKEDERYIRFVYKVESRLNRENAQYDRDQVRALKDINSTLGGLSAKIG